MAEPATSLAGLVATATDRQPWVPEDTKFAWGRGPWCRVGPSTPEGWACLL